MGRSKSPDLVTSDMSFGTALVEYFRAPIPVGAPTPIWPELLTESGYGIPIG